MKEQIKALAGQTLIYGTLTIVGRFLTFLLTPLYTNYLSMNEFGEITFILPLFAFINILFSFGMETTFLRFYDKNDIEKSRKVFSHSFLLIFLISSISTFLVLLNTGAMAGYISGEPHAERLIAIGIFIPLTDALMMVPYGLLRMTNKAGQFALTKFGLILIAVVLNFVFVVTMGRGSVGVLEAQLIANIAGVLYFSKLILGHLNFKIDSHLLKEMLRFGLPTIPASFSAIVLQVADKPLFKFITGDLEQLAQYGAGYKLGIPMMLLVTAFDYAWKPFYLNNHEEEGAKRLFGRVLTYFTLAAALLFLAATLFLDYIVRLPFFGGNLINPDYYEALAIVPVILGAYYFNGLFSNFAAGINITKKTSYFPLAIGAAAILNIVLNLLLIPDFGYWGAAWATLAAYMLSAVIIYFYSNKIYPLQYEWGKVLSILTSAILISAVSEYLLDFGISYSDFFIKIALSALFIIVLFASGIVKLNQIKEILRSLKK